MYTDATGALWNNSSLLTTYTAKSWEPEMNNNLSLYSNRLLFQLKPKFSFCWVEKKHYAINNEKNGNQFSFLQDANFSETRFLDAGLGNPKTLSPGPRTGFVDYLRTPLRTTRKIK